MGIRQRKQNLRTQRSLYKALVEAYEFHKIVLDTYGDIVTLKRRRDDADKDKEPSVGSDRGSKRCREGKELESTSASKEKANKTTGKSTQGSKSQQKTASKSTPVEEPMKPEVNATELKARRVDRLIKCKLTSHVYRVKSPMLGIYNMNIGGEEGQDAEYDDEELYRDVNINLEVLGIYNMNIGGEEGQDAEYDDEELYRDVNINLEGIDSLFESTPRVDVQASTTVAPITLTAPTLPPLTIPTISQVPQALTPPTTAPSTFLQDLPNFGSLFRFDHRLKTLEANFSEFVQTNQFVGAIFSILGIVERYTDQQMDKAVKFVGAISSILEIVERYTDQQMDKAVKVKVQVSKILLKTMNEQLEAKVLTRSSNSSKTSYVVAADLSELELKKILIEKIESNKSIHLSDEQRNLSKALVDAYECDKIILDTYRDTVMLKRRHDDADKDEEPFAGSDRGSKRKREGKEPESTSAPKEKAAKTTGKSTEGSKSHQKTASDSAPAEEPIYSQKHSTLDTPVDFSAFLMNRLKVDTLTPELLAGPTYELMKGSCKSLVELEFFLEEV
nr:hypothetical protein [Tanacetum cinerariifolium]